MEDGTPESDASHQPIRLLDSLRINETEGIHAPRGIARKLAFKSPKELASVLPKVGEDAPEEGDDHGQGAHQVFGVPLVR